MARLDRFEFRRRWSSGFASKGQRCSMGSISHLVTLKSTHGSVRAPGNQLSYDCTES